MALGLHIGLVGPAGVEQGDSGRVAGAASVGSLERPAPACLQGRPCRLRRLAGTQQAGLGGTGSGDGGPMHSRRTSARASGVIRAELAARQPFHPAVHSSIARVPLALWCTWAEAPCRGVGERRAPPSLPPHRCAGRALPFLARISASPGPQPCCAAANPKAAPVWVESRALSSLAGAAGPQLCCCSRPMEPWLPPGHAPSCSAQGMQSRACDALPTAFGSLCSVGFTGAGQGGAGPALGAPQQRPAAGSPQPSPQFSLELDSTPSQQPCDTPSLRRARKRWAAAPRRRAVGSRALAGPRTPRLPLARRCWPDAGLRRYESLESSSTELPGSPANVVPSPPVEPAPVATMPAASLRRHLYHTRRSGRGAGGVQASADAGHLAAPRAFAAAPDAGHRAPPSWRQFRSVAAPPGAARLAQAPALPARWQLALPPLLSTPPGAALAASHGVASACIGSGGCWPAARQLCV